MPLPILYIDDHLVAVDKPSGMVVHRSRDARDAEVCMTLLREQTGRWVYPVHRLDRGTSGALLFAFDPAAAAGISEEFRERRVEKIYHAVVRGHPASDGGTIDHPLRDEDEEVGREALTEYRVLARTDLPLSVGPYDRAWFSLVELRPHTGRRHQLRRHMRHLGHPIIGDTTWGNSTNNRLLRSVFGSHRLLLHAARLMVVHPLTGVTLDLRAPYPPELSSLLQRMELL